ncbi:MAG: hypothetical protein MPEBLZ_03283 [Candidatus Methanoperedens nitroreducens]|uniref:Uncharacterized protein n=1 Tax=Candidatus Methanoperedens nitratireducens TaxID=1392998 RepID=A0A0P8ADC8_9EURY|nr:hypothetical protein [Candidatus Methanoperedens sp. BLZ2]KAB2945606.1 MAG: hypothetical protein F9K14_10125 [Candidatus Methanoperedens sp.]KPQ42156.1 MAG: hypothetical protein MPEBLZ_03283 [Candidatus Methanoperedens sp. BLZ1]MBZ0176102.1 hypothetical protein [Candidatus Methanoperedens nitroreducens]MCX9079375.1 hypothetical protein [Candidatus Methanoperedens sp.]
MKISKQMYSIGGVILFAVAIALVFLGNEHTIGLAWILFISGAEFLYSGGVIKKGAHLLAIGFALLFAGGVCMYIFRNNVSSHRFIDMIFGGLLIIISGVWFQTFKNRIKISQQNTGDERTNKFLAYGAYYTWIVMIVLLFASILLDLFGIINTSTISLANLFPVFIVLLLLLPVVFVLYFNKKGDVP